MFAVRFGRAGANSSLARTTNLPTAVCTIMGWVKWSSVSTFAAIFNLAGAAGQRFYYGTNNSGATELFDGSSSSTGTTLTTARWYHMAMTNDATTIRGYLNGVQDLTLGSISLTPGELQLGTDQDSEFANAALGAIKVWNRALSVDQVAAEIPYAMPVDWAGLNACYPLATGWDLMTSGLILQGSTAASRWLDVSGNSGNDLSETGAIDLEVGPPIQFARPRTMRARYHVPAAGGGGSVFGSYYYRQVAGMQ